MTDLYLPGAKVIPGTDCGPMLGGARKVVWHTTENDPKITTAANVAKYLVGTGNTVHLVWHPLTGETVAMIPANRGAKGLENRPGGVETNRAGTYVIQIEVVGQAAHPFTDGPMVGLAGIQAWLTSLGIPAIWSGTPDRSVVNWAKAGHFGHVDVPEQNHTDPGNVNKLALTTPSGDPSMSAAEVATITTALANHETNEANRYSDLAGRDRTQAAQIAALTAAVAALAAHPDLTAALITTIISDAIAAQVKVTGTLTVVPN